jgi:sec-independent protein translocase protein TatA
MFGIGLPEILVILVVVLLLFGTKRLPEIGKALGSALKEFKKGLQGHEEPEDKKEDKKN